MGKTHSRENVSPRSVYFSVFLVVMAYGYQKLSLPMMKAVLTKDD
jgi:hypothetical protein